MEEAPLYKAAFHQRRAERHLKHYRFDEAISSLHQALESINVAYNEVQAPSAREVIRVLEDEYKRQVERTRLEKVYYETHKNAKSEQKISVGEEAVESINSTNLVPNPNELQLVIDRTIQNFDAKYSNKNISKKSPDENKVALSQHNDIDAELLKTYEDLDVDLPPLELPTFDFTSFRKSE